MLAVKSETRHRSLPSWLLFNIILDVLNIIIVEETKISGVEVVMEAIWMYLLSDGIVMYVVNPEKFCDNY